MKDIKYVIDETFGSYTITIIDGYTYFSFMDVPEKIINLIKSLESDLYSANCIIGEYVDTDKENRDLKKFVELISTFDRTKVDDLPQESRKLFDAIMSIADERDDYKKRVDKLRSFIQTNKIYTPTNKLKPISETGYGYKMFQILNGENNE